MARNALAWLARRVLAVRWTLLDVVALAAITVAAQFVFPAYTTFDALDHVASDTLQSARLTLWGAERRADGDVPLWNPYVYGGFPIHASGFAAFYYPGSAAYTRGDLLDVLPIDFAVHAFLAALGAYVLARGLCRNRLAALLAGIVAVFAAPGTLLLDGHSITTVHAFAYAPWALCGVRLAMARGRPVGGLIAAAALGLQAVTGAMQVVLMTGVLVLAFVGFDACRRYFADWEDGWRCAGKSIIALLGIVLGAAIGAAQLLPSGEYLAHDWRASAPQSRERIDDARPDTTSVEFVHEVVPALPASVLPESAPDAIPFGGFFLLSLAAFGVVRAPGREKWVFAALVFMGYGFIAGDHVQLYPRLYQLPFFDPQLTVREVAALTGIALAVLAGLGADVVLEQTETARARVMRIWPLWLLLAAATAWIVWDNQESLDAAAWTIVVIAMVGLPVVLLRGRAHLIIGAWLLACLAVDLAPGVEAVPRAPDTAAAFAVYGPTGEFVPVADQKTDSNRMALLPASDAPVRGYHAFDGIFAQERTLPMFDRHFPGSLGRPWWQGAEAVRRLWQLKETDLERREVELRSIRQEISFLSALNVEFVFAPSPGPLFINRMVEAGGVFDKFDLVHSTIFKLGDAMPSAYILHEATVRDGHKSYFAMLADPEFDPRRTVLVEAPVEDGDFAAGGADEGIHVERYEDGVVELSLFVDAPGILVLTDSFYPGWTVRFGDGTEREVFRVNEFLRGVRVQPGDERVVFAFASQLADFGLTLTELGVQAWGALTVMSALVWIVLWVRRVRGSARKVSPS